MSRRFTHDARAVVVAAQVAAGGSTLLQPAHLLEGVATSPGVGAEVLVELGAPPDELVRVVRGLSRQRAGGLDDDDAEALAVLGIDLDAVLARLDDDLRGPAAGRGRVRFSTGAKKALGLALREAVRRRAGGLGTEHLLLGLVRLGDPVVHGALAAFDLRPDEVDRALGDQGRRTG